MALVTGNEAVVTALPDRHWRAVGEGWSRVKHNWALPPLGRDKQRRKGEERRKRETGRQTETAASAPLPQRGLNFWPDIW